MRVKYNDRYINVKNLSSDNPKKEFLTMWNDYTIEVLLDECRWNNYKEKKWIGICSAPSGSHIVDGIFEGTMHDVVQLCFDNIGYPLETLEDEED